MSKRAARCARDCAIRRRRSIIRLRAGRAAIMKSYAGTDSGVADTDLFKTLQPLPPV